MPIPWIVESDSRAIVTRDTKSTDLQISNFQAYTYNDCCP